MMKPFFTRPTARTRSVLLIVLGVMVLANLLLLFLFTWQLGGFSGQVRPTLAALIPAPVRSGTPSVAPPTGTPTPGVSSTPAPTVTLAPIDVDIEALLAGMSLEQKTGQKIIAVLPGQSAQGVGEDLIRGRQIGGIVLYEVNVSSPEQVRQLTGDLQALAAGSKPAIPLLIAIDHEGGRSFQFQQGVTQFPSQMALNAAGSTDLAFQAARAQARELRAMGINVSFSPVLDVNDNPYNPVIGLRSFGDSPELVAEYGASMVSGLLEGGVLAVAKHFPGHGNTNVDSHGAIPFIDRDLDALYARELVSFQRAIQLQVPGIMVGHIANRALDPEGLPASLSRELTGGLLRERLGYQGVIFTDGLTMGPIRSAYPVETAARMAALAGSDILLYTNPGHAVMAQDALIKAVENGQLAVDDLDASVRRILIMKARLGLFDPAPRELSDGALDEHQALAREIARRAIYLQGAPELPLLKGSRIMLFTPDMLDKGTVENDQQSLLGELLVNRGLQVDEWIYPLYEPDRTVALREEALPLLPAVDAVVMVAFDGRLNREYRENDSQERLAEALYRSGVPVVLVAVALPYDLLMAPSRQPALAVFGDTPAQLEALVDALLSSTPPPGRLPVQIIPH